MDTEDYSIEDNFSLELIQEEYDDFLFRLYDYIKQETKAHSFLWFDKCEWAQFLRFALSVSTGPPNTCN